MDSHIYSSLDSFVDTQDTMNIFKSSFLILGEGITFEHCSNFFKDNDINIVINCSKDLPFINLDVEKVRLKIHDNLENEEIINMYNNLNYITKYINDNMIRLNKNKLFLKGYKNLIPGTN